MITKKLLKHSLRLFAVFYTFVITYISLIPLSGLQLPNFVLADKVVHFFLYFFLAFFWLTAFPVLYKNKITLFVILFLWGVAIELIQENYIKGRSGDPFDALANTIGILSGIFMFGKQKIKNKNLFFCLFYFIKK